MEHGADGFFFLTSLSFPLSFPPHLVCHFAFNILLDLALLSLSATPYYTEIYYLCSLLCTLDAVSFVLVLTPRSSFLQLQVCISLSDCWWAVYSCGVSRASLCPCTVTPCLWSSTPSPVSPRLTGPFFSIASLRKSCKYPILCIIEKLLVAVIYVKLVLHHAKINKGKAN